MRFDVPQFIEIEDKIFGPLTWKQFIYIAGGVGFAVVLFLVAPFIIFVLIGVPFGVLAILLAFYQVNDQPFSRFLEAMVQYFSGTKLYLWKKTGSGVYHGQPGVDSALSSINNYVPGTGKKNLQSLSRKLELSSIQKDK